MKKVTTIIGAVCMMGLLTFVSTSCKKNQENAGSSVQIVIPQAEEEIMDGRAYLNPSGSFFWNKNDQVRVYNLAADPIESTSSVFYKVGGTTHDPRAHFTGNSVGGPKDYDYRIFYPVQMVKDGFDDDAVLSALEQENRQTFTVSTKQKYSFFANEQHEISLIDPEAMPMAVKVHSLNTSANLQHMFGFLKFAIGANPGEIIVVDSIKLIENDMNITGEVSVKLDQVVGDELTNIANAYMLPQYRAVNETFLTEVVAPELTKLGWISGPVKGKEITLDCVYEHEDGETKGVTLVNTDGLTYFTFVVRPLACWNGFNLVMYIHNDDDENEPIEVVINRWNGNMTPTPGLVQEDDMVGDPNYKWAMEPKKIKTFSYPMPLRHSMLH